MTIHSVLVLNKSGGLIYCNDFVPHPTMKENDWIRSSGLFHGMNEVMKQLSLDRSHKFYDGISCISDDTFQMHCYHSLTGLKFIVSATPDTRNLQRLLKDIYGLYCDDVIKNPFHRLGQPIKSHKFKTHLAQIIHRTYQ